MKLIGVLFLLTFVPTICLCSLSKTSEEIHRIVVVGDIHGDSDNFKKILRLFNLTREVTNENGEISIIWDPEHQYKSIPMRTSLIQMGDLIDRGENDRECLDIAFSLYEQANTSIHNDKVVLLIGNHELLNLQGYYHYVNENNFGGFLTKPLRNMAFSPNGPYGRFVIEHFKAVHVEEKTIFVHAGFSLSSDHELLSENKLNDLIRKSFRERKYRISSLGSEGPLWTRRMIFDAMKGHCNAVDFILTKFNVERIIVGHTPQRSGSIGVFCTGKLLAVDVGISRWMYNSVAALEVLIYRYKSNNGPFIEDVSLWEVKETLRRRLDIIGQNKDFVKNPSHPPDDDLFVYDL